MKIEFGIACSRKHFTGHFDTKNYVSSTMFDRVTAKSVIQNMHYEKLNLNIE